MRAQARLMDGLEWINVEYIGVFQFSKPVGPSVKAGGHGGGAIAHPVAVVKAEGMLIDVPLKHFRFIGEGEEK